jgi:hypothetical protein
MNNVTTYISHHESSIQFFRGKRRKLVRAHREKRALNGTLYLEKKVDTEFSKAEETLDTIRALINIFLLYEKQLDCTRRRTGPSDEKDLTVF